MYANITHPPPPLSIVSSSSWQLMSMSSHCHQEFKKLTRKHRSVSAFPGPHDLGWGHPLSWNETSQKSLRLHRLYHGWRHIVIHNDVMTRFNLVLGTSSGTLFVPWTLCRRPYCSSPADRWSSNDIWKTKLQQMSFCLFWRAIYAIGKVSACSLSRSPRRLFSKRSKVVWSDCCRNPLYSIPWVTLSGPAADILHCFNGPWSIGHREQLSS